MDVKATEESFKTWVDRDFLDEEVKQLVLNADILLVPLEDFREGSGWTFERGTEAIYSFLKENLPNEYNVEICINDADYVELSVNSNYKRFSKILIKDFIAPVAIGIFISFITKHLIDDDENQPIYNVTNIINTPSNKADQINEARRAFIPAPKKYLETPKAKISIVIVSKDSTSKEFSFDGDSRELKNFLKSVENIINNDRDTIKDRE